MKLTRDRITGAYYTEDRIFKIQRSPLRAYGWGIFKQTEDGTYKFETAVATFPEARRLVIGR